MESRKRTGSEAVVVVRVGVGIASTSAAYRRNHEAKEQGRIGTKQSWFNPHSPLTTQIAASALILAMSFQLRREQLIEQAGIGVAVVEHHVLLCSCERKFLNPLSLRVPKTSPTYMEPPFSATC